ncbi:fimbrial protein [Pseudomonas reactans]|uniref:Fimbrial protein n=1 Tax=Pseudomonas reactans TaxID=117680 RepID=A0ABX2QU54_9PSED|nr:fimbrial protein [Pseudomonas reactans]NWA40822.1 fimbrial protein [Pseudomonas reactans]NWC86066.1 fimbrial protein [Pseudomonas reactans]NWD32240.1 fimbrial protein [Pseudomonas reactans]NWD94860.1 fimbrial protein [Pseudomonas reactans]NWF16899.1 fimbrial protein [Pseudomonas reactans]
MKRLYGVMTLLVLIGFTATANAATCRVNGGPWEPIFGELPLQVPVTVTLAADRTRIMLEGARLECGFSRGSQSPSWRQDFWSTGSSAGTPWVPGIKFINQGAGLRIGGGHYNIPIANGIRVATLPDDMRGYPIDVTPYILVRNNPSNPIDVRAGDTLGVLRLTQTNNYNGDSTRISVTYTAANNFTVSPSACTINNNNPIEINFGNVHQRGIGTDPLTTTIRKDQRLTYTCPDPGITSPITITYQGSRSSFDTRLLMMTNPDVGTAMVRAGSAVQVGSSFLTRIDNSVGGDDVTFTLVRRAGSLPTAGPISGSGVLIMGVP